MKKIYLSVLLSLSLTYVFAQNQTFNNSSDCSYQNELIINSGYDPATEERIVAHGIDPNWQVSYITPDCISSSTPLGTVPYNAPVLQPIYLSSMFYWYTDLKAGWLGYVHNNFESGPPTNASGDYRIKLRRTFNICQTDTIIFNLQVACDNTIASIRINDAEPIFTQSNINEPDRFKYLIPISHQVQLDPGDHFIEVELENFLGNMYRASNPFGVLIIGKLTSKTVDNNFIIQNKENAHCYCENTSIQTLEDLNIGMEQNYPNPFNESTTININLSKAKNLQYQFVLTDIAGKIIMNKSLNNFDFNRININKNELSAGVYYYSINVNGKLLGTKKMIVQ